MRRPIAVAAALIMCGAGSAESRFGRHVLKLSGGQGLTYVKRGENLFPVREQGPVVVSCMAYRESHRYYAEVGIFNRSGAAIALDSVSIRGRGGRAVHMVDTRVSAAHVRAQIGGPFVENPAPPARDFWPLFPVTATAEGGLIQDSADSGRGELALRRRYFAARLRAGREAAFAEYLERFAQEAQDTAIPPNETRLFIFTFENTGRTRSPFEITVRVANENVVFSYK